MSRIPALPQVIDKVLNVPWHNSRYPRLMLGGYTTRKGRKASEEHALLHTEGLENIHPQDVVLVRFNSACYTGDIFHDQLCDCNHQLVVATELAEEYSGPAVVIYHFSHEGKAHGWTPKLRAYADEMFKVDGDKRDFGGAVAILRDLGVRRVALMTNNPEKRKVIEQHGIAVVHTVPIISTNADHAKLLAFKRDTLGHAIPAIHPVPAAIGQLA